MTQLQKRTIIYSIPAFLLAVPFIAGFYTSEVNWSAIDFLIGGFLLFTSAFAIDMTISKIENRKKAIAICIMILLALFLIWAELAVGIFGSPIAGS